MYWRKSCACCKNWKSSLHGSRWLILIGFLKIIGYRWGTGCLNWAFWRPSEKQKAACTTCFPCKTLNSNRHPVLSPRGRELERGQQAARLVFWAVRVLGKIAAIGRIPSPQPSPTRGGRRLQQIQALQVVWKRMPEISTAGIFQAAFIARQMEQTPRAFFQTTFESIGRVCTARHARGGLGLQGKWRTRACVPHTPYIRATAY